jgi:hypothetical protein
LTIKVFRENGAFYFLPAESLKLILYYLYTTFDDYTGWHVMV